MPNSSDWGLVRFVLTPKYFVTVAIRATFHPDIFKRALLRSLKFRVSSVRSAFGTFTENMLCSIRHECGGLKRSHVEIVETSEHFAAKWKYIISIRRVGRTATPYLEIFVRKKEHDSYDFRGPLFEFTGAIRRRTRGYGYLDGSKRRRRPKPERKYEHSPLPQRPDVTLESLNERVNLDGVTLKAWPDRTTRPRNASLRRTSRE